MRGLVILLPGLLVAATGVGAGDLATASITGQKVGVSVLWAVLLGAFLKYVLNEGLARYQLATHETLLEGMARRLPRAYLTLFLVYFLFWSFFVGTALIGACGACAQALWPAFADAGRGKLFFGIAHSLLGLVVVRRGGFATFEKLMQAFMVVMFGTVLLTALRLLDEPGAVLRGLLWPTVPAGGEGLQWTLALMGGVGGTVTVLGYGYWIREKGRRGLAELGACRIDLGVAYLATAFFGIGMVIIGSTLTDLGDGRGATLVISLAGRLEGPLGPAARWTFLVGAYAAVTTSLLGVWQVAPQIFADAWGLFRRPDGDSRSGATRDGYLVALALLPLLGLRMDFAPAQKLYSLVGAGFMPFLALVLLRLNRRAIVGEAAANRSRGTWALLLCLFVFAALGLAGVRD